MSERMSEARLQHIKDQYERWGEAALERACGELLFESDALRAELTDLRSALASYLVSKDEAVREIARLSAKLAAAEQERDRAREALGAIARNADDADDLSLFRVQCRDFAARALKGEQ